MNIRFALALLTLAGTAHAAELKHEALQAWQAYVQSAIVRMQDHLQPQSHFLNIDIDEGAAERVRNGEIVISPGASQSMKKVPSGIIHDWLGAAFIAHARLDEVLSVVRDYDAYKEFYRPTVLDSRTLARGGQEDRFSMVLMNKSLFMKTALDSEYKSSSFSLSDRRWYSISETTRIREIEDYGTPDQHTLRQDEGSGFIWRLFSITRLKERDRGVYIELEAIALSRDIPGSLRWIVEPIVRRISKNSLMTSLQQTEDAVHSSAALAAWHKPGELCSAVSPCVSGTPGSEWVKSLH